MRGARKAVAIVAGLACAGCGGAAGTEEKDAQAAFQAITAAAATEDVTTFWKGLSRSSREMYIELASGHGDPSGAPIKLEADDPPAVQVEEVLTLSPAELAQLRLKKSFARKKSKEQMLSLRVEKAEIRTGIAVVFVAEGDRKKRLFAMVREDGLWKLDVTETRKLDAEQDQLNGRR